MIEKNKEHRDMNLNNNRILVKDILKQPGARALLEREFPGLLTPSRLFFAKNMTLDSVLKRAAGRAPQAKIDRILEELRRL